MRTGVEGGLEDIPKEIIGMESLADEEGRYSYVVRQEDLLLYEEMLGEDCSKEAKQGTYQEFLQGMVKYYLSDTSDYQLLYEQIPGQFQVIHLGKELMKGRLDHLWSVNINSGRQEKKAAQWLIYYMLSDTAQNELAVKSLEGLPLNKNIFQQVFLEAYQGSLPRLEESVEELPVGDGEWIHKNNETGNGQVE